MARLNKDATHSGSDAVPSMRFESVQQSAAKNFGEYLSKLGYAIADTDHMRVGKLEIGIGKNPGKAEFAILRDKSKFSKKIAESNSGLFRLLRENSFRQPAEVVGDVTIDQNGHISIISCGNNAMEMHVLAQNFMHRYGIRTTVSGSGNMHIRKEEFLGPTSQHTIL